VYSRPQRICFPSFKCFVFFVIQSIWQQESKYGRKNVCKCYFGDTMYHVSAGVYKHFEDLYAIYIYFFFMFEKRKGFKSLLNCSLNVEKGIDNCAPYSTYCASSPVQFYCRLASLWGTIFIWLYTAYDDGYIWRDNTFLLSRLKMSKCFHNYLLLTVNYL